MASFRDQKTHMFHGSYQQLLHGLDDVFKQVVSFERSAAIDRPLLDESLDEVRHSFEHWIDVIRSYADQAGSLSRPPDDEPAPRETTAERPSQARNASPLS